LCYGFDAVHGVYTETITLWLELAAIATVSGMAAAVVAMNARSSAAERGRDARGPSAS
jgi:hypothetical protein